MELAGSIITPRPPPPSGNAEGPAMSGTAMPPRTRRAAALAPLLLALACAGCGRGHGAPTGGSDVSPARVKLQRLVDVTRVEQRSIVYHVEAVGQLEAE